MQPVMRLATSLAASAALIAAAAFAQTVNEGGQKFALTLTGAAERPHTGDLSASGTADITINPGQRRVCWEITTSGIDTGYTITGAHIHRGNANVAGPVVIHLAASLNSTNVGCATTVSPTGGPIPRALLMEIIKSPEEFYVNVHWADTTPPITLPSFAAGGIRAQMDKAPLRSN